MHSFFHSNKYYFIIFAALLTIPVGFAMRKSIQKASKATIEENSHKNSKQKKRLPRTRKKKKTKKPVVSNLTPETCDYTETDNSIVLMAKLIGSEQDCIKEFGKNGKYLLRNKKSKKIYPIKLTIKNNRDTSLNVESLGIGLPMAPQKMVLRRLRYWTGIRAILVGACFLGIGAALFPLFSGLILAHIFNLELFFACSWKLTEIMAIPFMPLLNVFPQLIAIPMTTGLIATITAPAAAAGQTLVTFKKNEKIYRKVKSSKKIAIEPSKQYSSFIFVHPKDYKSSFPIDIKSQNGKLTFNVQLPNLPLPKKKLMRKHK